MGLNTQDAIVKFCDNIRLSVDESNITVAVFFGFSKAFDSVIFDFLVFKLKLWDSVVL